MLMNVRPSAPTIVRQPFARKRPCLPGAGTSARGQSMSISGIARSGNGGSSFQLEGTVLFDRDSTLFPSARGSHGLGRAWRLSIRLPTNLWRR